MYLSRLLARCVWKTSISKAPFHKWEWQHWGRSGHKLDERDLNYLYHIILIRFLILQVSRWFYRCNFVLAVLAWKPFFAFHASHAITPCKTHSIEWYVKVFPVSGPCPSIVGWSPFRGVLQAPIIPGLLQEYSLWRWVWSGKLWNCHCVLYLEKTRTSKRKALYQW